MGEVTACHCGQCRKLSGHYSASFWAEEDSVTWAARNIREYKTAGGGQRGFCPDCGSSLWFRAASGEFSMESGAFERPTGGRLTSHIFLSEAGDYYTLDDNLPQWQVWDESKG
nr:GFA family protein [Pseudogemmobacter hezensis]